MPRIINKLNTFLRLLVVGLLIYPLPIAMADHVPTQAPYGQMLVMMLTQELLLLVY